MDKKLDVKKSQAVLFDTYEYVVIKPKRKKEHKNKFDDDFIKKLTGQNEKS